jgi:hypothetical protein
LVCCAFAVNVAMIRDKKRERILCAPNVTSRALEQQARD